MGRKNSDHLPLKEALCGEDNRGLPVVPSGTRKMTLLSKVGYPRCTGRGGVTEGKD